MQWEYIGLCMETIRKCRKNKIKEKYDKNDGYIQILPQDRSCPLCRNFHRCSLHPFHNILQSRLQCRTIHYMNGWCRESALRNFRLSWGDCIHPGWRRKRKCPRCKLRRSSRFHRHRCLLHKPVKLYQTSAGFSFSTFHLLGYIQLGNPNYFRPWTKIAL